MEEMYKIHLVKFYAFHNFSVLTNFLINLIILIQATCERKSELENRSPKSLNIIPRTRWRIRCQINCLQHRHNWDIFPFSRTPSNSNFQKRQNAHYVINFTRLETWSFKPTIIIPSQPAKLLTNSNPRKSEFLLP